MSMGVMYSECLTPMENAGISRLLMITFSGRYAPGPGFCVLSLGIGVRPWRE